MWQTLRKINANLILAIPVAMMLGFVYGLAFDAVSLKALIVPLTFLMVYPMMVTLNIRKVAQGGDTRAQLLTQAVNFGLVPFFALFLGQYFFAGEPYMILGLLLAGLVPTSGMTISWTGFAKGNVEAAVKMTVIGLTIGSLATPFYVKALLGASIDVNVMAVMRQILLIVFLPMVFGWLTQRWLVKRYGQDAFMKELKPKFPALSTVGVIGVVFVAMALKARAVAAEPAMLLSILPPLALLYAVNFSLSTVIGRLFLKRGDAIAMVYGSVMRNLSIALAISLGAFGVQGSSAALVIAVAYIIQVQSAAWYVKYSDRIFGPPVEAAAADTAPAGSTAQG